MPDRVLGLRFGRLAAALLLAAAAAAYTAVAWSLKPGFYDGVAPPQPYRWVSPPPGIPNAGQPASGHCTVAVLNGVTEPGTCFTDDGQAILSYIPGSFQVTAGESSVTIEIKPTATYPPFTGFTGGTNVYLVTATAPLVKAAVITLRYTDLAPAPGYIYVAPSASGPWKNIGSSQTAAPYTIAQRTTDLGYFVAGTPSNKTGSGGATVSGGQVLPIIVAVIIVLVILAGIPLALVRRRNALAEEEEEEDGGAGPPR